MFNSRAEFSQVVFPDGNRCVVVDNALSEPARWVGLAAEQQGAFRVTAHNAYPGPEYLLPDFVSTEFEKFFNSKIRNHFGARRTLTLHTRLSMVTLLPEQLAPRQWICHRDRLDPEPDRCVIASVLYLFSDHELGGTNFFRPIRGEAETARLIHDSGELSPTEFSAQYGISPGYQTSSNAWFEKIASIAPKWNRMIFYDGGSVFHCSDIPHAERLSSDPRLGRLTLNGFFTCRRALAAAG